MGRVDDVPIPLTRAHILGFFLLFYLPNHFRIYAFAFLSTKSEHDTTPVFISFFFYRSLRSGPTVI